jgi:glycosyltransferase involved in cell wall biosynthesis
MIYDLLPLHLPNNFLPIVVENYVHKLRLLKYCDSVATDSVHLIPVIEGALQLMEVGVAPQILARPLHIEPKWLAIELRKPPQVVQFLQVGALENRKNHQLALSAFSQLRIPGRQYNIVGIHKRRSRLISELTEAVRLTSGSVRFLYGLSDEDIIELSRSVTAMVYPSTAEGYGLPILEGLAMGLPVIASDIAPHRQFNDLGGIVYFDPTSVTGLRQAMELVADPDENWRLRLSIQSDRIPANPNEWARETRLALET